MNSILLQSWLMIIRDSIWLKMQFFCVFLFLERTHLFTEKGKGLEVNFVGKKANIRHINNNYHIRRSVTLRSLLVSENYEKKSIKK